MQTLRRDAGSHPAAGENEAVESFGDATSPPPAPAPSQATLAVIDFVRGARSRYLWGLLGWQDIRRHYRRSLLGPFWLTVSMGVLVGALGTLWGPLLKVDVAEYIPFLAAGFVVWTFIQGVATDGCTAFINAESIIKQVGLPLSVHVFRVVWRNLLIFFHNAVIFVVVAAIFSVWPGWTGLLALPGLILLCLNVIWAGLLLGIVSARFRDLPPIVESVVRILFFLTPIMWMPELMPVRAFVLDLNPFYHLVELVRAPLLGQAPGLASWLAVSGFVLGGWLVTFELFRRYRRRIAYWV